MAEAVAAKLQAVQRHAQPILARIKGITPKIPAGGVTVRYHHFCHRGTVHDRAELALVLVANVVQDQAFAEIVADADVPALPPHVIALNLKARTFWLRDVQRFNIVAEAF